jgi:hypothetical protein
MSPITFLIPGISVGVLEMPMTSNPFEWNF